MDLEIKYEHGSMVIHLENFLDCRNISKVKKLVKIKNSFTPECEDKIREYVEQFRQEMREIKVLLRSWQSVSDKNIRIKEFYKKVLQIIT